MRHLKSRNGCHRHKEINILAVIEFQLGLQHFFPLFLFLVTAANTSWQKMCHLGSPANKRCVILRAGMVATVTNKETNILPLIEFQPGFQLFLSFFPFFFPQTSLLWEVRRLWLGLIMHFAKSCFPTEGRCFELFKYFFVHFASSRFSYAGQSRP